MQQIVCAIFLQDEKVLLGKRSPGKRTCPNQWDLIGGHVDADEEPAQALRREVREELGVDVEEFSAFQTLDERRPELGEPALFHFYLVTRWSGSIAMLGAEHVELRWFAIKDAGDLPELAHPDYPRIFEEIARASSATPGPA